MHSCVRRGLRAPQVFVSATIDVTRRGRAASWYGGLYRVGGVVGPLVGGAVAEAWSSRAAIMLQATWIVAAALAVLLWFPRQAIGLRQASVINTAPAPAATHSGTEARSDGDSGTLGDSSSDDGVVHSVPTSHGGASARRPTWRDTNACWNSDVMRIFRQYWYQLFTVGVFCGLLQFIREARPLVFPLAGDSFGLSTTEIGLVRASKRAWHPPPPALLCSPRSMFPPWRLPQVMSLAAVCDTSLFWTSGLIMDNLGRKWNVRHLTFHGLCAAD